MTTQIGNRLRTHRLALGLSYREAAAQIGMPTSTVHKIEHGGDPRLSSVERVSNWIGATDISLRDRMMGVLAKLEDQVARAGTPEGLGHNDQLPFEYAAGLVREALTGGDA